VVTFFTLFFENRKKRDFLRFFERLHTFSQTLACTMENHALKHTHQYEFVDQ